MHPYFKKTLNRIQEVVSDPKIDKTTSIINGVLDVAAKIGQAKIGGPTALVGATFGILSVVRNAVGRPDKSDPVSEFIEKRPNCEGFSSTLPQLLNRVGAMQLLNFKKYAGDNPVSLIGFEIDGKAIFFKVSEFDGEGGHTVSYLNNFWKDDGFDLGFLSDAVWKASGGPIMRLTKGVGGEIELEGSAYSDVPYIGHGHDTVKEFAAAVEVYHKRGMSRANLLVSRPGCGKTSWVKEYARISKKKLLIVDPDFVRNVNDGVERFVSLLTPDVLLLDDIDRTPDGMGSAMVLLDRIRLKYPKMVVLTTCNQIQNTNAALLRPGRLGETVNFVSPSNEEKVELLKLYMKRYEVDANKYDLKELADEMTHEDFSHDYVRFVAEQAVMFSQKRLLKCVADLNQHLDLVSRIEPPLRN